MPLSALPENYKLGPDNQSWLMRLKKKVQFIFAAGPRVPSGFWKWRDIPKQLILISSKFGLLRLENTDGSQTTHWNKFYDMPGWRPEDGNLYVARVQPWARWGISLQWPLFFSCWFIYQEKDVISPYRYQSDFGIKKMFTFYIGFKRDSDRFYIPTVYAGGNFE